MALPLIAVTGGIAGRELIKGAMTKPIAVVVFRTGPKKYAYYNDGMDLERGDSVIVPTESGVDLEATVVMMTGAERWAALASKTVISGA